MISTPVEDDWDFGPVFDLIHSLSISPDEHEYRKTAFSDGGSDPPEEATYNATAKVHNQDRTQLGDFNKIWEFLGQPLNLPAPTITTGPLPGLIDVWDGQTASEQPIPKAVRWQDDVDCANLADNDENDAMPDLSSLTKLQRKKVRRKQRREERQALATHSRDKKGLPSGSEDDSEKDVQAQRIPDRSSVIYQFLYGVPPPSDTGRLRSGKLFRIQDSGDTGGVSGVASPSAKQITRILEPVRETALEVAAAKKKKLLSMLNETFIDDRQYLSNLSFTQNTANNTNAATEGIHVFVDASNVYCDHSDLPLPRH